MDKNKIKDTEEEIIVPFSDENVLEDGFICDIVEESSIQNDIPEYVLEKILWY